MTAGNSPDGFAPHFRKSKFTNPWEPIFSRVSDRRVELAVFLRDVHCNSRGFVHGGLIAGLSDNAMGLTCGAALKAEGRDVGGLVTVSLNTEFLGGAQLGSWLIIVPEAVKLGGNLAFARALLTADDAPIAQASASFKIS
ncbi:MAG: PaaI family thioesterase [Pseudomonadota bacterium]